MGEFSRIKLIAFGTLREDLLLKYDFREPIRENEIKVDGYKSTIGGSVHNSCLYLATHSKMVDIILCTPNYEVLINKAKNSMKCCNYHIAHEGEDLGPHPLSIIGIRENGDKSIISCENAIRYDEMINLVGSYVDSCNLLYTSFYEISLYNYNKIVQVFGEYIKSEKIVMIDLCPLINTFSKQVISLILNTITVLSGNETEYQMLCKVLELNDIEDILNRFNCIEVLCVKKGEKGATVTKRIRSSERDLFDRYESVIVDKVIAKNTNGCGDVFNAVIINGLVNNWDFKYMIEEAVEKSKKIALEGLPWIQK